MKFKVIGPVDPQPRYPNHFKFSLMATYGYDVSSEDVTVLIPDNHPLLPAFVEAISRKLYSDDIEGSAFARWFTLDSEGYDKADNPAELAGYEPIWIEWPRDSNLGEWCKFEGYSVTWFDADGDENNIVLNP